MRPISAKTELLIQLIFTPIAATIAGYFGFYRQFPWQEGHFFTI